MTDRPLTNGYLSDVWGELVEGPPWENNHFSGFSFPANFKYKI